MLTRESIRQAFAKLHESGCFVIPNPWDIGTARYLRHLGFQALATTSAGFQFARGQADSVWGLSCDEALSHIREIVEATNLPVNADFQSGYAHTPEGVAENVTKCVETGVAGLSIEDATGEPGQLYELPLAVERIKAARAAIDATGAKVLLTGRAESYLVGHPEAFKDAIKRLEAYAAAGADVLYAPGPKNLEEIEAIVRAAAPKPINVLVGSHLGWTVEDLAALGVRRISVGSAFARAAWGGFMQAAKQIAEHGRFDGMQHAASFAELNQVFAAYAPQSASK